MTEEQIAELKYRYERWLNKQKYAFAQSDWEFLLLEINNAYIHGVKDGIKMERYGSLWNQLEEGKDVEIPKFESLSELNL